ncbi:MAG: CocE/NonD family hydrolase [Gemmatimonadota bacterium]|nr:CocE/NonD family hydrolase [Gemmatimonadota bacterium]
MSRSTRSHRFLLRLTLLLVPAASLSAQQAAPSDSSTYEQSAADIPMRDGVTLHVEILRPRGVAEPLPILLQRTPYGVESALQVVKACTTLSDEGYIFVFQDIRGRYRSQGTFVMQRPPKAPSAPADEVDELTDTNDSIEWMLANIPGNNGRVGMFGVSYDGWTAAMGMLGGHPALRAVSPQASPADMFIGDDFHHNGAFRLSYGFEYAWLTEATRENADFEFGGYQLMVANDVLRGRFYKSFERPVPLTPNGVTPFTVDLHTQSYRFQRGHKIMVQVQSTWFPLIDRNPQTWVPNIFEAHAADYRAQTHRIWRTPARPSRVDIQTVAE